MGDEDLSLRVTTAVRPWFNDSLTSAQQYPPPLADSDVRNVRLKTVLADSHALSILSASTAALPKCFWLRLHASNI